MHRKVSFLKSDSWLWKLLLLALVIQLYFSLGTKMFQCRKEFESATETLTKSNINILPYNINNLAFKSDPLHPLESTEKLNRRLNESREFLISNYNGYTDKETDNQKNENNQNTSVDKSYTEEQDIRKFFPKGFAHAKIEMLKIIFNLMGRKESLFKHIDTSEFAGNFDDSEHISDYFISFFQKSGFDKGFGSNLNLKYTAATLATNLYTTECQEKMNQAAALETNQKKGYPSMYINPWYEKYMWSLYWNNNNPHLDPMKNSTLSASKEDKVQSSNDDANYNRNLKNTAACIVVRNEAEYLDEFVAFHWIQGVGHFTFIDDTSTDNTKEVLEKYIKRNIVSYRYVSNDTDKHAGTAHGQRIWLNDCLMNYWNIKWNLQTFLNESNDGPVLVSDFKDHHYNRGRVVSDKKVEGKVNYIYKWRPQFVIFPDADELVMATPFKTTLAQILNKNWLTKVCGKISRTDFGTNSFNKKPQGKLVAENYLLTGKTYYGAHQKLVTNIDPWPSYNETSGQLVPYQGQPPNELYSVHDMVDIKCPIRLWEDFHLNHYLKSLEDYDRKILTHRTNTGRYKEKPLQLFWDREKGDNIDFSGIEWSCNVRSHLNHLFHQEAFSLPYS